MKRIWASGQLTNHGELSLELSIKLKNHLIVDNIMLCNNGTVPLQVEICVYSYYAGIRMEDLYNIVKIINTVIREKVIKFAE